MLKKPAETMRDVHPLIRDRWSPRAMDASKPVSKDDLISVLEAARWTASSNNVQPWRFIVATADRPEAHAKALEGFNVRNQRWAKNAPVLIIVLARKVTDDGAANGPAHYDTGAAVAQLVIQATALGLSVHQAGGIDKDKIRTSYNVPDDTDILVAFGLGYQADASVLPDDLAEREKTPRARKSLSDIVFNDTYGEKMMF
ncbi:MAG: nitroreductase [Hyphomicrobiales bacterium]|nr:nitroreductase [Hyphomicrobiales bacterium]